MIWSTDAEAPASLMSFAAFLGWALVCLLSSVKDCKNLMPWDEVCLHAKLTRCCLSVVVPVCQLSQGKSDSRGLWGSMNVFLGFLKHLSSINDILNHLRLEQSGCQCNQHWGLVAVIQGGDRDTGGKHKVYCCAKQWTVQSACTSVY